MMLLTLVLLIAFCTVTAIAYKNKEKSAKALKEATKELRNLGSQLETIKRKLRRLNDAGALRYDALTYILESDEQTLRNFQEGCTKELLAKLAK